MQTTVTEAERPSPVTKSHKGRDSSLFTHFGPRGQINYMKKKQPDAEGRWLESGMLGRAGLEYTRSGPELMDALSFEGIRVTYTT